MCIFLPVNDEMYVACTPSCRGVPLLGIFQPWNKNLLCAVAASTAATTMPGPGQGPSPWPGPWPGPSASRALPCGPQPILTLDHAHHSRDTSSRRVLLVSEKHLWAHALGPGSDWPFVQATRALGWSLTRSRPGRWPRS